MKIKLTFKDPDGVYESLRAAVEETIPDGLTDEEQDELIDRRMEDAHDKMRKWIKYQEYVTVEIDSDAGTAVVVPV